MNTSLPAKKLWARRLTWALVCGAFCCAATYGLYAFNLNKQADVRPLSLMKHPTNAPPTGSTQAMGSGLASTPPRDQGFDLVTSEPLRATPTASPMPETDSAIDEILRASDTLPRPERMEHIASLEQHLERTQATERLNRNEVSQEERNRYGRIFEKITALKLQNIREDYAAVHKKFLAVQKRVEEKQRQKKHHKSNSTKDEEVNL